MGKKTSKQLERHFKGVSNHNRISILLLLDKYKCLELERLVEIVKGNTKTISEHTRRLVVAGLIKKQYRGRSVFHTLTSYGRRFVDFVKSIQYS